MSSVSTAPKERVNIRYKTATGDSKQEVELPFKQLVLGEFSTSRDETPLEERERINIDKDNFESVMEAFNLSVTTVVADKISDEEGAELPVTLSFKKMSDFEPQSIIEQVPTLEKLYQLRQALLALKAPLGNVPQFRKTLEGILDNDEQRNALIAELQATEEAARQAGEAIKGDVEEPDKPKK